MPNLNPLAFLINEHGRLDQLLVGLAASGDATTRAESFDLLADSLTELLAVKQELVYPYLHYNISPNILAELIAEHVEIKRVLADLIWLDADDPLFGARLETLTALLEGHMMWQEEELFITVFNTMTSGDLAVLGTRLGSWLDMRDWQPRQAVTMRVSAAA